MAPGNFVLTEEEFSEQIESFLLVNYHSEASIVSEVDIRFGVFEDEEVYIRFQLKRQGPLGLRLQQMNELGTYYPITYLLLDLDRKVVVSGEKNEEGCFGVS